ncbi:Protein of unknown function [Gryllus bimaculatus]|nr:Protein of unknown function [Gryllus bimaculatus]
MLVLGAHFIRSRGLFNQPEPVFAANHAYPPAPLKLSAASLSELLPARRPWRWFRPAAARARAGAFAATRSPARITTLLGRRLIATRRVSGETPPRPPRPPPPPPSTSSQPLAISAHPPRARPTPRRPTADPLRALSSRPAAAGPAHRIAPRHLLLRRSWDSRQRSRRLSVALGESLDVSLRLLCIYIRKNKEQVQEKA